MLREDTPKMWQWKLNESLLQYTETRTLVDPKLMAFLSTHANTKTAPLTFWKTHRCIIRGKLISQGSKLKNEPTKQLNTLLAKIHQLKAMHKKMLATTTLADLQILCNKFNILLLHKMKAIATKMKHHFYEWGNKLSRLVANALHDVNVSSLLHCLYRLRQGAHLHTTQAIAYRFKDFYEQLYNCL